MDPAALAAGRARVGHAARAPEAARRAAARRRSPCARAPSRCSPPASGPGSPAWSRRSRAASTTVGNGPSPVAGSQTSTSSGTPSKLGTRAASSAVGQKSAPSRGVHACPKGAGGAAEAGGAKAAHRATTATQGTSERTRMARHASGRRAPLRRQPLGEQRGQGDEGAGRHPGAGPSKQRRAQPGPPPGEIAPRQGAGVDAGGPLQELLREGSKRRACGASIRRRHVPASSGRFPGASGSVVRCAPDETTRHPPGRPDPARARRLRRRARLLRARPTGAAPSWSSGSSRRWSRTTTRARAAAWCAACTSRSAAARRSSCAAARGAISTSSSTCAAARRPSASGRASSSPTRTCGSLYVPVGFAHGFCVLSTSRTCSTSRTPTTTPDRPGFKYDDPDVGIEWPLPAAELDPLPARPRGAAAQRVADDLPFEYR